MDLFLPCRALELVRRNQLAEGLDSPFRFRFANQPPSIHISFAQLDSNPRINLFRFSLISTANQPAAIILIARIIWNLRWTGFCTQTTKPLAAEARIIHRLELERLLLVVNRCQQNQTGWPKENVFEELVVFMNRDIDSHVC